MYTELGQGGRIKSIIFRQYRQLILLFVLLFVQYFSRKFYHRSVYVVNTLFKSVFEYFYYKISHWFFLSFLVKMYYFFFFTFACIAFSILFSRKRKDEYGIPTNSDNYISNNAISKTKLLPKFGKVSLLYKTLKKQNMRQIFILFTNCSYVFSQIKDIIV